MDAYDGKIELHCGASMLRWALEETDEALTAIEADRDGYAETIAIMSQVLSRMGAPGPGKWNDLIYQAECNFKALQSDKDRLTKALEDERERCADIVDALFQKYQRSPDSWAKGWRSACAEIEEKIRALSPPPASQSEGGGI